MLTHETYSEAVIAPGERDHRHLRSTGLIVDGKVVQESLLRRHGKKVIAPIEEPSNIWARARPNPVHTVIFGGIATWHYGHFLLESLARLWICRQMPGVPIAWVGLSSFNSWQLELLKIIGVSAPHIFVQGPERFATVVLPQAGYRIPDFFANEHRDFLAAMPAEPVIKGKKAWLSRRLLTGTGHVLREEEIEQSLTTHDWEIFHPQQHAIADQLRYLGSCETIAGWAGSAFHSLVLLKDVKTTAHIFQREPRLSDNFATIANAKRIAQHVHSPPLTWVQGRRSNAVHDLPDTRFVIEALDRAHQI